MNQTNPSFHDYITLFVLKLAKLKRTQLQDNNDSLFYESFFKPEDEVLYEQDLRYTLRFREVEGTLADLPPESIVVDAGCGLGHLLNHLSQRQPGHRLYGLDYSQRSIDQARNRLGEAAQVQQGSLLELPFCDNFADAIICLEVLEHIDEESKALQEIHRILKPQGRLVISVPSQFYFSDYLPLMGHYRHYQRADLVSKLEAAGFKIKSYLNYYPKFHFYHYYLYVTLAIFYKLLTPLFPASSIYKIKLPFMKKTIYRSLASLLESIAHKEQNTSLENLSTSTFICVVKSS